MAALPAPVPPAAEARPPGICVKPLRPPDAHLLDEVLAGLGKQSRYTRFHGPKPRLSAAERRYLSAADGRDHLALVAFDTDGKPLGIARAVRLRDQPSMAEVAAEVVDARQRQGIGGELLRRVARRATAVGIERLQATVLAQTRFAGVLRRRGWSVVASDGLTVTLEADAWGVAR
jgi:GNAT superfamily N-acetyltransferase